MNLFDIPNNNSCVVYHNFFTSEENAALYDAVVNGTLETIDSSIFGEEGYGKINHDARKSKLIQNQETQPFRKLIKKRITELLPDITKHLKMEYFEPEKFEIQITAHNHGDFFKPHMDNGTHGFKRQISFVYYFHSIPRMFSGGQLLFLRNQPKPLIIEPDNNTIVFFNSSLLHAVHPVTCPDQKFEHSRFTLNGWVHKQKEITEE